jgi:hypothetical protein
LRGRTSATREEHFLAAILSHIETRQVANDYTIRFEGKLYQIARSDIRAGLRGGTVRVERRLDGTLAVRLQDRYLSVAECTEPRKTVASPKPAPVPKKLITSRAKHHVNC